MRSLLLCQGEFSNKWGLNHLKSGSRQRHLQRVAAIANAVNWSSRLLSITSPAA